MTRTRGPIMNREKARQVVDKLKIRVVASDGNGVAIERWCKGSAFFNSGRYERWRVYTGGGIAGNSDQVWLAPNNNGAPRGPFWNKGQLERALRAWRRGD